MQRKASCTTQWELLNTKKYFLTKIIVKNNYEGANLLNLKCSTFIAIKSKIFVFTAIFGRFIDYLAIVVRSPNLVAKIYKGFPTRSRSLVRFWVKMYLWQTIYDNTHLVKIPRKNDDNRRTKAHSHNRISISQTSISDLAY